MVHVEFKTAITLNYDKFIVLICDYLEPMDHWEIRLQKIWGNIFMSHSYWVEDKGYRYESRINRKSK